MKNISKYDFFLLLCLLGATSATSQPSGSVTQGLGVTTISDLMPNCPSNHKTPLGQITSSDGKVWTVPAENNFQTAPNISDLYNTCNGVTPANLSVADLSNVPVTEIDANGELITGFLFADNYFELYVNGVLVGVDPVPFTPFNSCVVKFRVAKPYTLAVKLVDWEENPGLGTEINNNSNYHPGDGGFIAQFSDGTVTDASWKVQTYYIAPIQNLDEVVEMPDGSHSTANANLTPTCDDQCYGVHYPIPPSWMLKGFDEQGWQNATLYTAAQVTNQAAYTNFANTAWPDARFIWSANLILDNVVLARKVVGTTSLQGAGKRDFMIQNPFSDRISFVPGLVLKNAVISLINTQGAVVAQWSGISCQSGEKTELKFKQVLSDGLYFLKITQQDLDLSTQLVHCKH